MGSEVMEREYNILANRSVLVHNKSPSAHENAIYNWAYEALETDDIKSIVWVCFNRPPYILKKIFDENNIHFNKPIKFVDMISSYSSFPTDSLDIIQCASPTDYSCLHMHIDELLDKCPKTVVVFDNLNAILSYNPDNLTIKLMRTMNNIVPQKNSATLYFDMPGACDERINVAIGSTVEKIYEIGGITDKPILEFSWADINKISWYDVFSLRHYAKWIFILFLMTIFANIMLVMTILFLRLS